MSEKETLIEVSNLKQYFPVSGSRQVVKAVDGVSFPIEKRCRLFFRIPTLLWIPE
ncbi:MAG: hypothetical protein IJT16_05115 [Lachnospiraceae bacterium]|nr:hypothetical protein [Lachnospiraceae bacterium]